MSNYTTKTAALKATTVDTRLLDAKRIDTKSLFINNESLETVIYNSSRYVNNAVKISSAFSSCVNQYVSDGEYEFTLTRDGVLIIHRMDDDIMSWEPIQLTINNINILTEKGRNDQDKVWVFSLWDSDENLEELYGGITDDTMIEVLIVIHDEIDGNEPIKTQLVGFVEHNVIYQLDELENLDLKLPESFISNYTAEVIFTSGSTPTNLISDSRIKWVGDDVNAGVFAPIANVRYSCSLQYDGVFVRGVVFGIPTV